VSVVDRKFSLQPGLHQFPQNTFGSVQDLMHPAVVRKRDVLMVACSELGSAPDNVSFHTPNRCVVLQHLAASIPSRHESENIKGLAFDHVEALNDKYNFRHVIVCGHLHCGVIRNWLRPLPVGYSDSGSFRTRFERGTRDLVDQSYAPDTFEQRLRLMICEHVLCQIDNLITHPFIAERVKTGTTSVHGWVVDDDSARVFGYSPSQSAFVPI